MTDYNFKPKKDRNDFGWHDRGRIPHLDAAGFTQFVTFRLFDSMPPKVLEKWRIEMPDDIAFRKTIEGYLDSGYGECWLRDDRVASVIEETLLFHHRKKYTLEAWVLMPNHGHVVLTPLSGVHLPAVMHSIKSYTAQAANKILGRQGQFWQHQSFDRYIRNNKHFAVTVRYIEENPVAAGLCEKPEDWRWGSAYYRNAGVEW
jgi:REP element-mobilizing transposase RayT